MVFCNSDSGSGKNQYKECHNPYFNRWFSAISESDFNVSDNKSHNPYFNRWFSAIQLDIVHLDEPYSHNPYFNRWFSAIYLMIHL